ncbi:MAG: hypothetical protein MRJ67_00780 [Nitrospirales bacterium]|nr:hypothetical protein [Nitrospirales bacterium]
MPDPDYFRFLLVLPNAIDDPAGSFDDLTEVGILELRHNAPGFMEIDYALSGAVKREALNRVHRERTVRCPPSS